MLCASLCAMWSHVAHSDKQHHCIPRYLCFNITFLEAPFQYFLQGTTVEEELGKIRALEIIEMELAEQYGMGGCVDSVAVFQEAKRIAFL